MGPSRIAAVACVFALLEIAACGQSTDPADHANTPRVEPTTARALPLPPMPAALPGVDTSALSEAEKRTFFRIVDTMNSPCGQPVSIARCIRESTDCSGCRHAARFAVRLLTEGYPAEHVSDLLRARYAADTAAQLSIEGCAWKGGEMARVTIIEFADFECPHCKEAHEKLDEVLEDPAILAATRLCYRFFPLSGHPNAAPAARAAVAAMNQGKFWQMHDLLYEHQMELTPALYLQFGTRIGLDMARFQADLAAPATAARVDRDRAEGDSLHLEGTPAIYVNGRMYNASTDVSSIRAYIREELER
jgi:protein-disulfide isomerase